METNITHYFYSKLNRIFENNIKFSYISNYEIILVTNEDKVYIFNKNTINNSLLVFSNNQSIIEKKINASLIKELCNKGIIDFKNSGWHTIARTTNGKLYSWGRNWCGVLGNGRVDQWNEHKLHKPQLNEYLKGKQIINIKCGEWHSLALTNDGDVYSWGWNNRGQIGNKRNGLLDYQTIPYNLNEHICEKVVSISCGFYHSLVLTQNGRVYSWGDNEWGQLGRNIGDENPLNCPKLIEINENTIINKISCGRLHSLLLSREGEIYVIGSNKWNELGINKDTVKQPMPIKLNSLHYFTDIASQSYFHFSSALSQNGFYYIWGKVNEELISEPKEIELKSFNEISINYLRITFTTLEAKIPEFSDDLIRNGFYDKEFHEQKAIGEGSYKNLFRVKKLSESTLDYSFAIKRIEITFNEEVIDNFTEIILKEVENFSVIKELNNENVIKYYDLWFENMVQQNCKNLIVFTQMELCDMSLKEFISCMKNDTKLVNEDTLNNLGYYISSQLFIQILEGIHYLHTRNPQIIHRDINPSNILIKMNGENNSVVKIANLGLACLHEYKGHKHTQDRGNILYAAPEVRNSTTYDTRADIYSLGVVLQELFLIDINRDYENDNENSPLMQKYHKLSELYDKMTQNRVNNRPENCQQILNSRYLWSWTENKLIKDDFKELYYACDEEYKESFIEKLIKLFIENPYKSSSEISIRSLKSLGSLSSKPVKFATLKSIDYDSSEFATRSYINVLLVVLQVLIGNGRNRSYREKCESYILQQKYLEVIDIINSVAPVYVNREPNKKGEFELVYEWVSNETKQNNIVKVIENKELSETDEVDNFKAEMLTLQNILSEFEAIKIITKENKKYCKQFHIRDIFKLFKDSKNVTSKLEPNVREQAMGLISEQFSEKREWFRSFLKCLPYNIGDEDYSDEELDSFCSFFQNLINRAEYNDIRHTFAYTANHINKVLKNFNYTTSITLKTKS